MTRGTMLSITHSKMIKAYCLLVPLVQQLFANLAGRQLIAGIHATGLAEKSPRYKLHVAQRRQSGTESWSILVSRGQGK